MNLVEDMTALATAAKNAARLMPRLNTDQKNLCLNTMADAVEAQAEAIQAANALDMETAREMKLSQSMMDRLLLNEQRIAGMAQGLREVAELPDPVPLWRQGCGHSFGRSAEDQRRAAGQPALRLRRFRPRLYMQ